jgi:thiamine-phosphate pyrophosphorylase
MMPGGNSSPALSGLIDFAERALAAGVDMIQIREPDLSARDLFSLAQSITRLARLRDARVLVNDRADVAASTGAGVHLTTRSMTPDVVRATFGPDLLIGASTHSHREAAAAQRQGADFVVFGPVFDTPSKRRFGRPVGLGPLGQVAADLTIPVLALGGIKITNFQEAIDAGAAGVAAISLFTESDDLAGVVRAIKGRRR